MSKETKPAPKPKRRVYTTKIGTCAACPNASFSLESGLLCCATGQRILVSIATKGFPDFCPLKEEE